jgi:integrase
VPERSNGAVLKTVGRASASWVRIPPPPYQRVTLGYLESTRGPASLLIAAGVNSKAISTYMGQASITITLDRYGHLMPGSEAEAADLLDAYIQGSRR